MLESTAQHSIAAPGPRLRNGQGTPLRIGYLQRRDAQDPRAWSGTMFTMARSLEAYVGEVVYLGPDNSSATSKLLQRLSQVNNLSRKFAGRELIGTHNRVLARRLGKFFEQRLRELPCDVLFAPAASIEVAGLNTTVPIVYYSDITWELILDYYPQFTGLTRLARAEGERIEVCAIGRSAAAVFPSEWAARSAREHYGARPESTFVVPFGANLPDPPTREQALRHSLGGPVRLLMVGVDWIRKGGAIAFECLTSLLARGIDARLTLCGCVPPAGFEHPNFEVIPFLNKKLPEERARFTQLFLDAHFFLFPTRADATPIAICEAGAYGLPTLATNTGGVGGAIRDGVNGFLIPYEAGGTAYAEKIAKVVGSPELYRRLVTSARDEYETRLNWDAWGRGMRGVFESVMAKRS